MSNAFLQETHKTGSHFAPTAWTTSLFSHSRCSSGAFFFHCKKRVFNSHRHDGIILRGRPMSPGEGKKKGKMLKGGWKMILFGICHKRYSVKNSRENSSVIVENVSPRGTFISKNTYGTLSTKRDFYNSSLLPDIDFWNISVDTLFWCYFLT